MPSIRDRGATVRRGHTTLSRVRFRARRRILHQQAQMPWTSPRSAQSRQSIGISRGPAALGVSLLKK